MMTSIVDDFDSSMLAEPLNLKNTVNAVVNHFFKAFVGLILPCGI